MGGETSRERWLALAFFALVTIVFTYPLSVHPGSTSLGSDPDVHTFTWTLGWDVHALLHRPWAIFDANIFYPYERTLAFSENLIGSAFVAAPVIWLTGNYVLAMNVVALLSVVVCGLGAFVLARQLGVSVAGAVLCGLVFAFSPARFFRLAQIHLTAVQWIPFTLAALHVYLRHGRPRDLRLAAGLFTLQVLTSLHGGVYLALAIAVLILVHLATGTAPAIARRLRDLGVTGVLLLLPNVLLAVPYLRVQREMGLVRSLENWIPTPESFLASPTHVHSWLASHLFAESPSSRASAFLFPGIVPIVLAIVAVMLARRRLALRREVLLYALVTLLAIVLAAGPPLSIWPYVYWLPGFNFIRIPSRFFLLAVLGLAVLSGIGFDRLAHAMRPARRLALALGVCCVFLIESAAMPLPVTPYTIDFAPVDRWLLTQPAPFAIAEVPVGPTARYHSTYMLHSMAHWQRTVHAHSSLTPAMHEQLYDRLRSFPDVASLDMLASLHVTYIVVHIDMYRPGEFAAVDSALAQYAARLEPIYADETGRVYRVR